MTMVNSSGRIAFPTDNNQNNNNNFCGVSSIIRNIAEKYHLQTQDVVNVILGDQASISYKNALVSSKVQIPLAGAKELAHIFSSNYQGEQWEFIPPHLV